MAFWKWWPLADLNCGLPPCEEHGPRAASDRDHSRIGRSKHMVGADRCPNFEAKRVLRAAMAGNDVSDPALALAESILAGRTVQLAREVAEGGPHAVRAAIELAGIVLAAGVAREGSEAAASDRRLGVSWATPES